MRRRTVVAAGIAALGGCLDRGASYAVPDTVAEPPGGVYVPTHAAALEVVGVADAGDARVALCYSYPDRFWELRGETTYRRDAEGEVHLMVLAWEPETGVVLPDLGMTVAVTREGETVFHEAVYPMLSQRLGFHYGDNVPLPVDGRYDVTARLGGTRIRRTGAFAGRFGSPASATFTLDYARADRNVLSRTRPEDAGTAGAVAPATLDGVPVGTARSLPGDSLGTATTDDARLVGARLDGDAARRYDADEYLALSVRTPYNGLMLPSMGARFRVERGGDSVAEGALDRTLDPVLGYHYGAAVPPLRSGDTLVVDPLTPPQVARHEGYETAFVELSPRRLPV